MTVPRPPITIDLLDRNFRAADRDLEALLWIVIHDMEMPEKPDTAEGCRDMFNLPGFEASAQYCIDNDSIVQAVALKAIAWAALRTANDNGIHLEHAGYARQTSGEWLDPFGVAMLKLSAWLTAWLCERTGIPARRLTVAEIRAGKRGIVGHDDLTAAGIDGNTHTDPGPHFPWDWYLDQVQQILAGSLNPLEDDDMKMDDTVPTTATEKRVWGLDKVTVGHALKSAEYARVFAYDAKKDAGAALEIIKELAAKGGMSTADIEAAARRGAAKAIDDKIAGADVTLNVDQGA